MQDGIVIKSSKAGMTVILNPDLPFPDLLASIAKKFGDSARFWGNAQMTLTLEGRPLSAEEEFQIVNTITENSQLQILCLLDTDAERIERCEKALNEKLMELSAQTGQFYRGTLKRGDTLESEASIVIIGDVEHGARVTAKGNVIILGELKGTVTAGAAGNDQAVILAFSMSDRFCREWRIKSSSFKETIFQQPTGFIGEFLVELKKILVNLRNLMYNKLVK